MPRILDRARRWLLMEWILTRQQRIIVAMLLLIVVLAVIYNFALAHAPHHTLNTILKYEEKSNGVREYFGRGVNEAKIHRVPPRGA